MIFQLRLLIACILLTGAVIAVVPSRADDDDDNVVRWHNLQPSDENVDPNMDCPGARIEWSVVTFELDENERARQQAEDAGDDDFADQIAEASAHGRVRQEKLQAIIDSKCPK